MGILVLVSLAYITGLTGKSRESYMQGSTSPVMSVVISQRAEHNTIGCGHVLDEKEHAVMCSVLVFGCQIFLSDCLFTLILVHSGFKC